MLTLPLPLTLTRFPRPYYGRIFALLFSGFQATRYLVITPSSARTLPSYHPNAALLRLPGGLPGLLLRVGPPARGGPAALARAHAALRGGVLRALHRVRAVARGGASAPDRSAGGRRGQGAPGGATATRGEYCGEEAYATQGSNPRLAEPRRACYSRVRALPWTVTRLERRRESKQQLYALCHKLATRWVFWAMLVYCASYSPAVEYSTHVTSYLKEMTSPGFVATKGSPEAFVCLQSALCEGRYRTYVVAYTSALLLGSLLYDRASQLDRAFLVGGLLLTNTFCWAALALAEPDAPAPAWVKAVIKTAAYAKPSWRAAAAAASAAGPAALGASPAPLLALSVPAKTALTALAGASIALPSSLPFAIFSLDFGKEGAAVLSSILQVVCSRSLQSGPPPCMPLAPPHRPTPSCLPARTSPRIVPPPFD